jgi:hypothetical protein
MGMTCIGTRWALRQKSTGFYIPAPTRGKGLRVGISEFEPTDGPMPALYGTEKAAHSALAQWLKGVQRAAPLEGVGNWGRYAMGVTPVASRRADDMEVVPVKLMVEV